MPYYAIDWSRYANHVEIRTPPDATLLTEELLKWPTRLLKFILFYLSYRLPSKHKWMGNVHIGVLMTLSLLFLAISAVSLRFLTLRITLANARLLSVFAYLFQCSMGSLCLTLWQVKKVFKNFIKLLETCTLGVGMLKNKKTAQRLVYGTMALCGFWPLIWMCYFTTHAFFQQDLGDHVPKPWNGTILWVDSMNIFTYIALLYMSLCWWIAHIYVIAYHVFALIEMHTMNMDLKSDENLFQVPVLKHYASIHYRLNRLYLHISGAFKPLSAITHVCNLILLYCHALCLFIGKPSVGELIFTGAVVFFVFCHTFVAILISTLYEKMATFIFDATLLVSVSDRNLYPEYYPVINSYHDSFWMQSRRKSVFRRVAEVAMFVIAFFILLYYNTLQLSSTAK